jgi:uncharacterized membrane protein YeiH
MQPEAIQSLLTVLDFAAVAVFAVTGALIASRKEMDVVGFLWLGIVTGVGGGSVRDLLLGQPVFWVREPMYVIIPALASIAVFATAHLIQSRYRVVLWLDAIGLAMVTIVGTAKGLAAGVGPIVAIVMGVITAVLGGIIRDLLGGEPTIISRREIYVTASLLGALVYVACIGLNLSATIGALSGFIATFGLRGAAMTYGWYLPAYRSRPGRPQPD